MNNRVRYYQNNFLIYFQNFALSYHEKKKLKSNESILVFVKLTFVEVKHLFNEKLREGFEGI